MGSVETRLKELLVQKAEEIGASIEKMEVMPDHVHQSRSSNVPSFHCSAAEGLYFKDTQTGIPYTQ